MPKKEVYEDKGKGFRWRILADNGKLVAESGEAYSTEQGAKKAGEKVQYAANAAELSDGYHTFQELYDHRSRLYVMLLKTNYGKAWRSRVHEDGTMFDGYFIAGIHTPEGDITYHLEDKYWNDLDGMITLDQAEHFDGHTPADVVDRLQKWSKKV